MKSEHLAESKRQFVPRELGCREIKGERLKHRLRFMIVEDHRSTHRMQPNDPFGNDCNLPIASEKGTEKPTGYEITAFVSKSREIGDPEDKVRRG